MAKMLDSEHRVSVLRNIPLKRSKEVKIEILMTNQKKNIFR